MTEDPEFGPGGYLPERAAKRARKIVLREPLGLGWVVGSLLAGLVLVVAGLLLLGRGEDPLRPPFVPAGPLDQAPEVGAAEIFAGTGERLLLVRAGQPVRVFRHPGVAVTYCTASRRLESADARVWNLNGRLVGGEGDSLQPVRHLVHDGEVYVDLRHETDRPDPDRDAGISPECV
jgi:hypothetical protein